MVGQSKACLITGCSSGIGRAIALRLARSQWRIYASARNPDAIADLQEAGWRTLALDVTYAESIENAVATIERECVALSALVNNAGFGQQGPSKKYRSTNSDSNSKRMSSVSLR